MGPCGDALARCGPWVILPVGVVRSGGPEGPDAVRGDTGEGASRGAAAAGLGWTRIWAETEWADGRVGRLVLLLLRWCHFFSVPAAGSASCYCPSVVGVASVHICLQTPHLPHACTHAQRGFAHRVGSSELGSTEPTGASCAGVRLPLLCGIPWILSVSELALISAALPSETDCDIVRPSTNGREENICMSTVGSPQIPI